MKFLNAQISFRFWLGIAVVIRLISAYTHASYAHPDEWFKTVEIAEYLVRGTATYCQEIALHYTNMFWPFILTLPIEAAEKLFPHSIHFKIFSFQFFIGLLDLGIPWGWWSLLRELKITDRDRNWAMLLLLFPWFLVHDSIRPTSEHLSAIAFWVSLGFLARRNFLAAGVMALFIAVFRYPSALLTAGLACGVLWGSPRFSRASKNRFALGLILGLVAGGLPDWIIYGRPWESFWMYLQYNIFTGLSHLKFGSQSPSIYWSFISGRWFKSVGLFGFAGIFFGCLGVYQNFRKREPWAFAFIFFLLAHLIISHKEPRFIAPIEILFFWAAFLGIRNFWEKIAPYFQSRIARGFLNAAIVLGLIMNLGMFVKSLWGETWALPLNYLELPRHLAQYPDTCGVIIPKRLTSVAYPFRSHSQSLPDQIPFPSLGVSPFRRDFLSFDEAQSLPVIWIDQEAHCAPEQSVLIQTWKPDVRWEQAGCTLLDSGILSILPKKFWPQALDHPELVASPWYRCSGEQLKIFTAQLTEKTLFHRMVPIDVLPPIGASVDDILRFDAIQTPEAHCKWLCPG